MPYRLSRIATLLVLLLLFAFIGCRPKSEPPTPPSDSTAISCERLQSAMNLTAVQAEALLDLLAQMEFEGEILFVYPAEREDGVPYFHLWIGEQSVDVYLDETGAVAAVAQSGVLLYGAIPPPPTEASPPPASVTVTDYTNELHAGERGYVRAVGTPGISYSIHVYYAGGPSTAKGLEPRIAAEDGTLLWEWSVSRTVKPEDYHIVIFATDDEADRLTLPFSVLPALDDPDHKDDPPSEELPPVTPTLKIESYTNPAEAGTTAQVHATGKVGMAYGIKVYYSGGPSSAQGLSPKIADAGGSLAWSFTVSAAVAPGDYEILLYRIDDPRDALTLPFTVIEKQLPPPVEDPPIDQTLTIGDYTAVIPAGEPAHLHATGRPGIRYSIKVYYSGGASSAQGLSPQTANESGALYWTWKVSTNIAPGNYRIVLFRTEEEKDTLTLPFTVTEKLPPTPEPEDPEPPVTATLTTEHYTASVAAGETAEVSVRGRAGDTYQIKVLYSSGPSSAQGLIPKTADENGVLTWRFQVSPTVSSGEYSIVICRADDERDMLTLPFTVTEKTPLPPQLEEPVVPTLILSSYTASVAAGEGACVSAVGSPGETYRIRVYYIGGASTAQGLEDQIAASDGHLTWTWRVGYGVAPGTYDIKIFRLSDSRDILTLSFQVTERIAPPEEEEPDLPASTISLQSYVSQLFPGENAFVHVLGTPGVLYQIKVSYAGGSSTAGLENQYAGVGGLLRWQWTVPTTVRPGTYRIKISRVGDSKDSLTLSFTVR